MKKLIIYCLLLVSINSCKEYVYTTKYHNPASLFDKDQFAKNSNSWDFYIHDANGNTYKTRSESIHNTSFEAVLIKTVDVNIPDTLEKVESHRKNEVHVYTKDSTLKSINDNNSKKQRTLINEKDVVEVVSYLNPNRKNEKLQLNKSSLLKEILIISGIIVAGGILTMTLIWLSWLAFLNLIGCYIATLAYGSYDAPEVLILRRFRDEILSKTFAGRVLIANYYVFSSIFVKYFKNAKFVHRIMKSYLDRYVIYLKHKHNW